jgi:hypothetical protein
MAVQFVDFSLSNRAGQELGNFRKLDRLVVRVEAVPRDQVASNLVYFLLLWPNNRHRIVASRPTPANCFKDQRDEAAFLEFSLARASREPPSISSRRSRRHPIRRGPPAAKIGARLRFGQASV